MSNPIILSDEEDDDQKTPLPSLSKRAGTGPESGHHSVPTVLVLDDDLTPQKPGIIIPSFSTTHIVVPDTPMSDLSIFKCTMGASNSETRVSNHESKPFSTSPIVVPDTPMSDLSVVKCTMGASNSETRVSYHESKLSGCSGLICLEAEIEEPESGSGLENWKNKLMGSGYNDPEETRWSSRFFGSMDSSGGVNVTQMSEDSSSQAIFSQDDIDQVHDYPDKENFSIEQMGTTVKQKRTKVNSDKKNSTDAAVRKKMTREERARLMEEKKLKKEQEKLQKAALKAEAAKLKQVDREKQKWEKGKYAMKSIVAEIDTKVVEQGSVGGHLLTRFANKGLTYRITSNPIQRSIVWTMSVPEQISELSPEGTEIRYVLLVYEAEEFCNLIVNESLLDHIFRVHSCYPSYTICYLMNRLMAYVKKREQEQYKNPENDNGWRRPPIEEVLAKLTTHFGRVHYMQCRDEAELAEHVVGLTCNLASCQFRKRLTRLSVNANGSLIPKDFVDRNLIKKSPWLKALVAIPKVQPRFAIAIWKKYPTMKSLLSVYMDPSKSVHEKEFLLEDLTTEGLLGHERRVGEVCSKRVYRILMAQNGSIKTDDIEDGADFFGHRS